MCIPERLKDLHGQKLPGTPKYSAFKLPRLCISLKELQSAQIQLAAYTCHHAATRGVTHCTQDPVCVVAECLCRRFGATCHLQCSTATGSLERPSRQPNGTASHAGSPATCNTAVAHCSDCPDEI